MKAGVQIYSQKLLHEVTDDGVVMLDLARLGEKIKIKGDNVIIMGGLQPDATLYQGLKDKGLAVYAIGDCIQPRGIHEAIYEGHLTARSI